jgi:HK97 family phage prohead protease
MPLLLDHNHKQVIGTVTSMQVVGSHLLAHATLLPPSVDALADNTWAKLQAKALSSFSIGFMPIDGHSISTGMHYSKIDIHELSVVSVPANAGAMIISVADEVKALPPATTASIPADAQPTYNFSKDPNAKPREKLVLRGKYSQHLPEGHPRKCVIDTSINPYG